MSTLDITAITAIDVHTHVHRSVRGDADPYVLADPVYRTQHYAPHGRYVSIAGAGHFGHEEAPEVVNEQLSRFLAQVYG